MKKILVFSTAYFPFVGGAEVAVKETTDRVNGWQFDLITARRDRELPVFERIGNVAVWRVGFGLKTLDKFILPLLGYFKAKKLNQKNDYGLIWSIMASQASVAAAFFKMTKPSVKLLLTLQEGDEEEHLKRYALGINFLYRLLIRPWHLLVFKKADYLTAISNYLKERALANGVGVSVEIVPNGVDIKKFEIQNSIFKTNSKSPITNIKTKLGIKSDDKLIITVSRLVKKNAVGDIIESLQFLPANVKLLILGSGPLKKNLKLQVLNLKLQDRVLFLGSIPNDEVPQYLAISDVFVRPSLSEGLGNSFLEAMAAGVPIVGTRVGGISDFLFEGKTGLFCEARNPESIAEKIKILLEDGKLREKIINNAKELVVRNYDWNVIAKKIENVFTQLTVNN